MFFRRKKLDNRVSVKKINPLFNVLTTHADSPFSDTHCDFNFFMDFKFSAILNQIDLGLPVRVILRNTEQC
jgi:ribosome-associated toxin RatA of RatAB toxin-antitoxin module